MAFDQNVDLSREALEELEMEYGGNSYQCYYSYIDTELNDATRSPIRMPSSL